MSADLINQRAVLNVIFVYALSGKHQIECYFGELWVDLAKLTLTRKKARFKW